MRSIWTRIATLGVAAVIAAGAAGSASAAHHKRHVAPVATQDEMIDRNVQLSPRNDWSAVPPSEQQGPYGCTTDEGYGRHDPCDVGGS
jgi:hypothetical protein